MIKSVYFCPRYRALGEQVVYAMRTAPREVRVEYLVRKRGPQQEWNRSITTLVRNGYFYWQEAKRC